MKTVGKHILIIPEGWCEYNYAQTLKKSLSREKQRSILVEMPKPNNENNALQLLNKPRLLSAKARRDKNPYDAIWIFFDNDNQPYLTDIFNQLSSEIIQVAYSCISIEHWFLIHLEDNRQAFLNSTQAEKKLQSLWKKHFNQRYHKTKLNHYQILKSLQSNAIRVSKAIRMHNEIENIPQSKRNPYFTIDQMINYFDSL